MQIPVCFGRQSGVLDIVQASLSRRFQPPRSESSLTLSETVLAGLEDPRGAPAFHRAFTPDDRIVLVIDPELPSIAQIVTPILDSLVERVGVAIERLTLLLASRPLADSIDRLRAELPTNYQCVPIVAHDPSDLDGIAYLASTSTGQRIYLNRLVVDADAFVVIGRTGFDAVTGRRGASSDLYPGLSKEESIGRSRRIAMEGGQSPATLHHRQECDEVARLSGLFYSLGVALDDQGAVDRLWFGHYDSVQRAADAFADEHWIIRVGQDPSELVIAVCSPSVAPCSWSQVAAALESAAHLARSEDGRIVLLTDLEEEPGPAVSLLRDGDDPWDALGRVRDSTLPDCVAADQLARVISKFRIYLLSRLDVDLVESLGMVPLSSLKEVANLARSARDIAIVESADRVHVAPARTTIYRRK